MDGRGCGKPIAPKNNLGENENLGEAALRDQATTDEKAKITDLELKRRLAPNDFNNLKDALFLRKGSN